MFEKLLLSIVFMALGSQIVVAADDYRWLDLLKNEKYEAAAAEMDKIADKVEGSSHPDHSALLRETIESVRVGFDQCDESSKVTLFRGIAPGQKDVDMGAEGRPLYLAKTMVGKSQRLLKTMGLPALKDYTLSSVIRAQSGQGQVSTYLLSASYSAWVASGSEAILVLRVCPQRILNRSTGDFIREYEVFLPFLIHTSEIYAILSASPRGEAKDFYEDRDRLFGTGDEVYLKFHYSQDSDAVARKNAIKWARANIRFATNNVNNFRSRLQREMKRRQSRTNTSRGTDCELLLEGRYLQSEGRDFKSEMRFK